MLYRSTTYGIPIDNIEKTVLFYEEMGFDKVYETYNRSANQKVLE